MRGRVRIIGGKWRRRTLPIDLQGNVRPTPDRVRETLFNWLAPYVPGATCLDLFAGTGVLGFEAVSRGAARVTMIENHPQVYATLIEQAAALGADNVDIVNADALAWLDTNTTRYDIVFLDPPYQRFEFRELCARITPSLAANGAQVYFETAEDVVAVDLPPGWQIMRRRRAGLVKYCWATATTGDEPPPGT